MIPDQTLADFLSGDGARVVAAAHAVRGCHDRAMLAVLAEQMGRIRAVTRGLDLGGALRPNVSYLDVALRKLEAARGNACLCTVFSSDEMADPQTLAAAGVVEILSEIDDPKLWETRSDLRCKVCGTRYTVREDNSYHYPWFEWARAV